MPQSEAVSTFKARFLEAHGSASRPKLLLVDDTADIRDPLGMILEANGFDVVVAANVNDALKWIHAGSFDVLVSDLHMPLAGDGLTVVSAMRNANPDAVTLIYSGHPSMKDATAAILLQADDILVKPMGAKLLVKTIWERLATGTAPKGAAVADVATILEQGTTATIENWLERVKAEPEVITVAMSDEDRRSYLPKLLDEVVARLRSSSPLGTRASLSPGGRAARYASPRAGLYRSADG